MAMRRFQVGFFGVGNAAQPYLDALARRPDVALTAICDPVRRVAEQTAAGWGAQVFADYEALLEENHPDALWICVDPRLQGRAVQHAVERQIPFFCVPPGAPDFEGASRCGELVRQARLVSAVGFATRYTDVVQEAREYLGAHAVPLALGWWLRPPSESATDPSAVNLSWNDGCALVDALRYFCGDVKRVHALTPADSPGGLVVQLQFASGGVGVLTCAAYPRPEPRVQVELLGDGWSLEFGGPGADAHQLLAPLRLVERDRTTVLRCLNQPPADYVTAFLDAVAANNPQAVASSYAEALRTLAVCHAAAVSAKEGRAVDVAEAT
jgi:predicted dehydrogenase